MKHHVFSTALLVSAMTLASAANATILIFDQNGPNNPTSDVGVVVPAAYGDNVAASPQGGFTYGNGGEGFTPNVVTSYNSNAEMWSSNFGDLTNVLYADGSTGFMEVTLTADAGFEVLLHDFDMAGWDRADYTINSVSVLNGGGGTLFSQANALIQGDGVGPGHTDFDFVGPLTASTIRIQFDSSNLGSSSDNIGIDNIRFAQRRISNNQIPEPGTLALFGLGLAGLGIARRKRTA